MKTNPLCPICGKEIKFISGSQMNINDGITAYCPNKECRMQDWGHGKNEKEALVVFLNKCGKGNKDE